MAGVSRREYGERLSPSPIYYIVVIVKKDHLCVAQVNCMAKAIVHTSFGYIVGKTLNIEIAIYIKT